MKPGPGEPPKICGMEDRLSATPPARANAFQFYTSESAMRAWKVWTFIWAGTMPLLAQAPSDPTCRGTVVDAHGTPVAGAEIAQFWLAGSHTPSGFRPYGASRSKGVGTFQIKLNNIPTTLFAVDSEGQQAAIVPISEIAGDIRVQLQPVWRVHYRFEGPSLTDLSQSRIMLKPLSGPMFSQIAGSTEGGISLDELPLDQSSEILEQFRAGFSLDNRVCSIRSVHGSQPLE